MASWDFKQRAAPFAKTVPHRLIEIIDHVMVIGYYSRWMKPNDVNCFCESIWLEHGAVGHVRKVR